MDKSIVVQLLLDMIVSDQEDGWSVCQDTVGDNKVVSISNGDSYCIVVYKRK